jgi:branched-subunit amino acid transport protein
MSTWIAVVVAGAGTYFLRASMLVGLSSRPMSRRLESSLTSVAPAVVAVIVALALRPDEGAAVRIDYLIAAVVAFIVVRRTRAITHGALAGLSCIWIAALAGLT